MCSLLAITDEMVERFKAVYSKIVKEAVVASGPAWAAADNVDKRADLDIEISEVALRAALEAALAAAKPEITDEMLDAAWSVSSSDKMSPKFNVVKHDIYVLLEAALASEPARIQVTDEMVRVAAELHWFIETGHRNFNQLSEAAQGQRLDTMRAALEAALSAPSHDVAKCKHGFAQAHDWVSRGISGQQSCPGSSAPAVRRPSRLEIEALHKSSPNGFDEPKEEAWVYGWNDALDDVLALFDAEPECKYGAHVLLPDDAEAK